MSDLTDEIMAHWHEMDPEQQRLFKRFAKLLPTARGDELARRQIRRSDCSLQDAVDLLERRAELRERRSHGVAPIHPRVLRRMTEV